MLLFYFSVMLQYFHHSCFGSRTTIGDLVMDRMIIMSPMVRIQTTYYTLGTANTLLIDNERRLSSLSRKDNGRNGKKKTPFIASTFSFYPPGFS